MTKQELIDNMREMVKYILPDKCRDDKGIVENYTDTMVMIAEEYRTEQLKLNNVSQQRELLEWLSNEDCFNISKDEISEILEDWQTYNSNYG